MTLLDRFEAERQRDRAIDRVRESNGAWIARALPIVRLIAEHVPEFTTDRLEYELHRRAIPSPRDKRAIGALMLRAQRARWIEKTDRVRPSVMPSNHRRPKTVWRSMLRGME